MQYGFFYVIEYPFISGHRFYSTNFIHCTRFQLEKWIDAYILAKESCGAKNRPPQSIEERDSLLSLFRGVYAKEKIKKGDTISKDKVFFAMPLLEGKLSVNDWRQDLIAEKNFETNEALEKNSEDKKAKVFTYNGTNAPTLTHDITLPLNPTAVTFRPGGKRILVTYDTHAEEWDISTATATKKRTIGVTSQGTIAAALYHPNQDVVCFQD